MKYPFRCWLIFFAISLTAAAMTAPVEAGDDDRRRIFDQQNLVAWCIVPFDDRQRTPEQRSEMLRRLGISKFAYDYRAEHLPTFDAEMQAIKRHGIELTAWWFPQTLNEEARVILDVLRRHGIETQLWVSGGGGPTNSAAEQRARVEAEAARIGEIAAAAAQIGCRVSLYNHGGWFGQPENQIEIIRHLDLPNVGIVYNLHHGHEHLERFAELLSMMLPHLDCLNLNGMVAGGDQQGKKILRIGEGDLDLQLLRVIRDSGYQGPIGILNHTQENAEVRLRENIEGLQTLVRQLERVGDDAPEGPAGDAAPQPDAGQGLGALDDLDLSSYSDQTVRRILRIARRHGDASRGLAVFTSATSACINCHRIGEHGGRVGPPLTSLARQRTPAEIVEAVYWPQRTVPPEFVARAVLAADGQVIRSGFCTTPMMAITWTCRSPTRDTCAAKSLPWTSIRCGRSPAAARSNGPS